MKQSAVFILVGLFGLYWSGVERGLCHAWCGVIRDREGMLSKVESMLN